MHTLLLNVLIYCLTLFGLPADFLQEVPTVQQEETDRSLLVIRQYDGFCEGDSSLSDNCLSYAYPEDAVDVINAYIKEHGSSIKELVIENPSGVLFELDIQALSALEIISMFGNDYDTDRLSRLPGKLLRLPHLKQIDMEGVRFPTTELERLRQKFPQIDFPETLSEY